MKKFYEAPVSELIVFSSEDIMDNSIGDNFDEEVGEIG